MEKFSESTITVFVLLVLAVISTNAYALSGSGSEANPWVIASLSDFTDFLADSDYWADYTRLDTDIDLYGITYLAAPIAADISSTVGFQGTKFTGSFDGNGHLILYLTLDTGGVGNDYLGLFGYVDTGAEIKNLGIEDCNIAGGTDSDKAGALLGQNNYGIISDCYATGTVTDGDHLGGLIGYDSHGQIDDCYAVVTVTGDDWLGGLAGYSYYSSIEKCYSTGSVTGDLHLGGLTGYLYYGSVDSSYSISTVIGNNNIAGLVGFSYHGDVDDCYSAGTVSGSTNVGGLIGDESSGTADNSFWDEETSNQTSSAGGTGKSEAQMQAATTFTSAGWGVIEVPASGPDYVWTVDEGDDYPRYIALAGGGSEANPFIIATRADFDEFCANELYWQSGIYTRLDTMLILIDTVYTQAPIAPDLPSSTSNFDGTPYEGVFDGNNQTVYYLTIDTATTATNYLGLFGCVTNGGQIKNLHLESVDIDSSSSGYSYNIGTICGKNDNGSVTGCSSKGTISINSGVAVGGILGQNELSGIVSNCQASVEISINSGGSVGGLVGNNALSGQITKCRAHGDVIGSASTQKLGGFTGQIYNGAEIEKCFATGAVSGGEDVAGFCGYMGSNSTIDTCYSVGLVDFDTSGDGFLGDMDTTPNNEVLYCFWDIETSDQAGSAAGVGKTTAQMKTLSTFLVSNWNLVADWNIEDGQTYPLLRKYSAFDTNYDGRVNMIDFAAFADNWLDGVE